MGNYVEQNLNRNETIVKKAELSKVPIIIKAVWAVICIIALLLIIGVVNGAKDTAEDVVSGAFEMEEEFGNSYYREEAEEAEDEVVEVIASVAEKMIWFFVLIFGLPTVKTIIAIIRYLNIELAVTNKRVIGKTGVIKTNAMDTPLNKVQTVSVSSGLWGKIFNYGKVRISLASLDSITFEFISHPEEYKRLIMNQIDQYEQDQAEEQAKRMANAMNYNANMNQNANNNTTENN